MWISGQGKDQCEGFVHSSHLAGTQMSLEIIQSAHVQGAQLLHVRYRPGWPFIRDATQVVTAYRCPREVWRSIGVALELVPRDAFDYIWLINPPPYDPKLAYGLEPVWRSGTSVLYRIESNAKSDTPAGNGIRPIT